MTSAADLAARVRAGMDYGAAPALAALDVLVERLAAAEHERDDARISYRNESDHHGETMGQYDDMRARALAAEQDNERLRAKARVLEHVDLRCEMDTSEAFLDRAERAEARVTELERALEQMRSVDDIYVRQIARAVLGSRPHQEQDA